MYERTLIGYENYPMNKSHKRVTKTIISLGLQTLAFKDDDIISGDASSMPVTPENRWEYENLRNLSTSS